MSFLNDLINNVFGGHPQTQQHAAQTQQPTGSYQYGTSPLTSVSLGNRSVANPPQGQPTYTQSPGQQPGQYAQYMNPNGTGGGFGPLPPQHLPNLLNSMQGGAFNPGYIPFQNSGQGGPGYAQNLQPAQNLQQTQNPQNVVPWQ